MTQLHLDPRLVPVEPVPLSEYQRMIVAALKIGSPGVALMYTTICQHPGCDVRTAAQGRSGGMTSTWVVYLERAGLIRTAVVNLPYRHRRCWPTECP